MDNHLKIIILIRNMTYLFSYFIIFSSKVGGHGACLRKMATMLLLILMTLPMTIVMVQVQVVVVF